MVELQRDQQPVVVDAGYGNNMALPMGDSRYGVLIYGGLFYESKCGALFQQLRRIFLILSLFK